MYILSDEQVDYIRNDLIARGVEREDLQLNLLDHVCCIIEDELPPGGDFRSFYAQVIRRFYRKELREIEEETTLLLTFKHYYAMKKTMIISGIASAAGFIAATIFKFNHWPGTGVLFVLSFAIFALLFLPLMFVLKMKENPEKRNKLVLVLGMLLGVTAVVGVMFKIMHWPGASIMMYSTLFGLVFVYVPIYFFSGIRNPLYKLNTIVTTVLLVGCAGILMSLVSVRPSWFYQNMQVQGDEMLRNELRSISQVAVVLEERAAKDTARSAQAERVKSAVGSFIGTSNDLIDGLRKAAGGGEGKISYEELSLCDAHNFTMHVFFADDETGKTGLVKKLRAELETLEKLAAEKGAAFKVIDDGQELQNGRKGPWEYIQFYDNTAAAAARKLMLLQVQARTLEMELLMK